MYDLKVYAACFCHKPYYDKKYGKHIRPHVPLHRQQDNKETLFGCLVCGKIKQSPIILPIKKE